MPRRITPRSASEWAAVLPRYLGMLGVVVSAGFWMATGRLEPVLFTGFLGLIGVGHGFEALAALKQAPPVPPPTPDTEKVT